MSETQHSAMESLNANLVSQSMNFNGQQMQKLWEAEYGENDLHRRNVKDLSFQVYSERQKYLSFQDRGKRLKLQQFIVKKANMLFSTEPSDFEYKPEEGQVAEDTYAIMPPFETYLNVDKQNRLKYFFKVGALKFIGNGFYRGFFITECESRWFDYWNYCEQNPVRDDA